MSNSLMMTASPPISSGGNPRGKFTCERCHREYNYMHNLRRHLKYECGNEKTFQCMCCVYKAKRRDVLRAHILAVHKDKNFFNTY